MMFNNLFKGWFFAAAEPSDGDGEVTKQGGFEYRTLKPEPAYHSLYGSKSPGAATKSWFSKSDPMKGSK
jgi:hypothetical protein